MNEWKDDPEDESEERAKAIFEKIDEGLSKLRRDGRWDDLHELPAPLTRREAEG